MACACKVNQDLSYLTKRYGNKMPKNQKTNISESFWAIIGDLFVKIIAIMLTPLLFLDILHVLTIRGNKPIMVSQFTPFKGLKNVRKVK